MPIRKKDKDVMVQEAPMPVAEVRGKTLTFKDLDAFMRYLHRGSGARLSRRPMPHGKQRR